MKLKAIAASLAMVVTALAMLLVNTAPAGATQSLIGSMPSYYGTVSCYSDSITPQADGADHVVFCNHYNSAGQLIENSVYQTFNFENCDTYRMYWNGLGNSYIDIWNAGANPGLEFVDSHGHYGGCGGGLFNSWSSGTTVVYPDEFSYFHGASLWTGKASRSGGCGGHSSSICPGMGTFLRFYLS